MKKKNKKSVSLSPTVTSPPFVSRIPREIAYVITFLFAFVAFHYYCKVYPALDTAPLIFFHCYTGAIPTMKHIFYFCKLVAIYGGLTALFFAACRGYGFAVRQYALCITTSFDLFIDIAFGLALTIVYAFVLSMFRAFIPLYAYCYVGIGCVLCVYFLYRIHKTPVPSYTDKDPYADNLGIFSRFSLYLLLIVAVGMTLMNATTPETFYDSLVYHLGLPQVWINDAHIYFPQENMRSFLPLNLEVLYGFAMLIKDDILAKYMHVGLSCITVYLVYVYGKTYFSKAIGLCAALIFFTTPTVLIIAYKTAVEIGIGFFETLAFVTLLAWFKTNTPSEKWKYCVISGICMGLALGSKYISMFALMATMSVLFYQWLKKELTTQDMKYIVLYGIVVCAVAAPWYIKNYVYTGNPIFPLFSESIGFLKQKAGMSIDGTGVGAPSLSIAHCLLFPWKLTMGTLGTQVESFAGLVYLIVIPLFVLQKNKSDKTNAILLVYCSVYLIVWLLKGKLYVRYAVQSFPLLALLIASYMLMNDWHRIFRKAMVWLVIAALTTNVLLAMQTLSLSNQAMDYIFGCISKQQYLATGRPTYPSPYYTTALWINAQTPPDATILFIGEHRGCFFKRSIIPDEIFVDNQLKKYVQNVNNADALYAVLKKKGITHIFWNVPESTRLIGFRLYQWTARDAIIFDTFFRKYCREVFKSCNDILLVDGTFLSSKDAQWDGYKRALAHYVYVYEITPHSTNLSPSINFLIFPFVYDDGTWAALIGDASFTSYLKTTYPDLWEQGMFEKK